MKHSWIKYPTYFRCWKCGEESPIKHRKSCLSRIPPKLYPQPLQSERVEIMASNGRELADGTWQSQAERDQLNQVQYQRMAG